MHLRQNVVSKVKKKKKKKKNITLLQMNRLRFFDVFLASSESSFRSRYTSISVKNTVEKDVKLQINRLSA